jgi:esterase/lipase
MMLIIISTTSMIINIEYSTYYLDEIATLKKKVVLLEASNHRLACF